MFCYCTVAATAAAEPTTIIRSTAAHKLQHHSPMKPSVARPIASCSAASLLGIALQANHGCAFGLEHHSGYHLQQPPASGTAKLRDAARPPIRYQTSCLSDDDL